MWIDDHLIEAEQLERFVRSSERKLLSFIRHSFALLGILVALALWIVARLGSLAMRAERALGGGELHLCNSLVPRWLEHPVIIKVAEPQEHKLLAADNPKWTINQIAV